MVEVTKKVMKFSFLKIEIISTMNYCEIGMI
jgi:hypothetical protein